MNLLERELHYPLGDTLPAPGADGRSGARRPLDPHGAALRAGPHQPLAAARQIDGVEGWTVVDCCIIRDESQARSGSRSSRPSSGPADPARHRDPHAPRPHRPGALAVRALERAAVDQRDRLQRGARARPPPATRWSAATRRADFFASHGLTDPEAVAKIRAPHQLLRQHGARRCRRASCACWTATTSRSAAAPGAASAATAMRPSTSRSTARSSRCCSAAT